MSEVTGGCRFDGIRISATGSPRRVGVCHCYDCRKHHGVLFYASAVFAQDAVTIHGETSDHAGWHFFPQCGSSVFAWSDDEIKVHLGSLDVENQFVPTYESWIIHREAWLQPVPGATQYDRGCD